MLFGDECDSHRFSWYYSLSYLLLPLWLTSPGPNTRAPTIGAING